MIAFKKKKLLISFYPSYNGENKPQRLGEEIDIQLSFLGGRDSLRAGGLSITELLISVNDSQE